MSDLIEKVSDSGFPVKFVDISVADHRLRGKLRRTQMQESHLRGVHGMKLYYKLENMHETGSFKERGALNALLNLSAEQKKKGVIAASAGNHALALAYHGSQLGIPVTVVMPTVAPLTKIEKSRAYGAKVIISGTHIGEARLEANKIMAQEGQTYINGFDDPNIIAGAGTLGLEILSELEDVDAIIVPVGGAGLLAGITLAVKSVKPMCEIIPVESTNCPSFKHALECGKPTAPTVKGSLADGLAVPVVGANSFAIAKNFFKPNDVILVSERDIALAIVRLMETEKIVSEGSGAVGLAAIMSGQLEHLIGKKVVVCVCGGNIDITVLGRVIERGLFADGRIIQFDAAISDRPGGLRFLTGLIAEMGGSVKEIMQEHPYITDVSICSVHIMVEVSSRSQGELLLNHLTNNGVVTRLLTDEKWADLNNHIVTSHTKKAIESKPPTSPLDKKTERSEEEAQPAKKKKS